MASLTQLNSPNAECKQLDAGGLEQLGGGPRVASVRITIRYKKNGLRRSGATELKERGGEKDRAELGGNKIDTQLAS